MRVPVRWRLAPCLSQTLRNDTVDGWVKYQPEMCSGDWEVGFGAVCLAISPVNDSVALAVHSGFCYRRRHRVPQLIQEIASAVPGVAVRKHAAAVFYPDTTSNNFGRMQDAAVGHCTAKRRTQGDNRSDI